MTQIEDKYRRWFAIEEAAKERHLAGPEYRLQGVDILPGSSRIRYRLEHREKGHPSLLGELDTGSEAMLLQTLNGMPVAGAYRS